MDFLIDYKQVFIVVHILGVALALGGATITDFSFFRALRDKELSDDEMRLLKGLTIVIWIGVLMLVTSGFALFWPNRELLLTSAKFLGKMLAVLVAIVNGIILGGVITPRMQSFDFTFTSAPSTYHRMSYSLGAISALSWYSAFFLAFLPARMDVPQYLFVWLYVGAFCVAIVGGQVMYMLSRRIANEK